ncbi:hypothetical protein OHC33_009186 [Knufia fluminis]|uniref:Uncharacterized protein n=1 Tax=Knufia fluminis TaxID=191047 RepID=A0AAN8EFW0_9EURO|nr:hypothetical protein OHC33_009186 [Knufia fluminis]
MAKTQTDSRKSSADKANTGKDSPRRSSRNSKSSSRSGSGSPKVAAPKVHKTTGSKSVDGIDPFAKKGSGSHSPRTSKSPSGSPNGGSSPPSPEGQKGSKRTKYTQGQILHVPDLASYLPELSGDADEDDEEEQEWVPAIVVGVYEERILVLPIFAPCEGENVMEIRVVSLQASPEPGDPHDGANSGNFLVVNDDGDWMPKRKAYVKVNFVVAVDNHAPMSYLDGLNTDSKRLLNERVKFVLGDDALYKYNVQQQGEMMEHHIANFQVNQHSEDWLAGYAAARAEYGGDDGDGDDGDDGDDDAGDDKHAKEGNKRPSKGDKSVPGAGGKVKKGPTKKPAATKNAGADQTEATDGEDEEKPKRKLKVWEEKDVPRMRQLYKLPRGRWFPCGHDAEHRAKPCRHTCCTSGSQSPPDGYPLWRKEHPDEAAAAEASETKPLPLPVTRVNNDGAVTKPKSKKPKGKESKIKNLPQKIPKAAEAASDDACQQIQGPYHGEDEEVARSSCVNDGPRKASAAKDDSAASPTKTAGDSPSGSGSHRPSKASSGKKGSQSSTGGGDKKTSAGRKASNESNGSNRSSRSKTASTAQQDAVTAEEQGTADEAEIEEGEIVEPEQSEED